LVRSFPFSPLWLNNNNNNKFLIDLRADFTAQEPITKQAGVKRKKHKKDEKGNLQHVNNKHNAINAYQSYFYEGRKRKIYALY
jgi:hypothetical protein